MSATWKEAGSLEEQSPCQLPLVAQPYYSNKFPKPPEKTKAMDKPLLSRVIYSA